MTSQPTTPLELFYSYSHKDEELRDLLETHLSMLKRDGVISDWHDRRVSAGQEWNGEIDEHLKSADIILLLVSADFLASNYCYDIEVKLAMDRHDAGKVRVVPIVLRPCDWQTAPFGKVQALPKDAKPVTLWPNRDEAFVDVAKGIRRVAEEIRTRRSARDEEPAEPPRPNPYLLIPDLRVNFVSRKDGNGKDIVKLLQEELSPQRPRLVALWGAGGVGKTAIAAEAVRGLIEPFGKRIAWVSADGLENFSLTTLLDTIATQLGNPDLRKLSLDLKKDQVRDLVRIAPTLVVLDNFETIEPAEGARCVEWLGRPIPCSALITTRDGIEGARDIPIEVMRSEEANELLDQLIAQAHDAKAFTNVDRERLIQTAEANPLVLQWIVGQIDLAQDPDEVLDDLRHGEGSAAERVFNRSFELKQLNNGGRAVLLALSLFAPSATRKAVAEVSGLGKDADRQKFKNAVKSLAALWLLHTTVEHKRLAVEGLTRELTKSRLEKDPRGKTFRSRFVSRFLRYAESHAEPTREDYDALDSERDNLLSATDMAFSQGNAQSVLRLAYSLVVPNRGVLDVRGYWEETLHIGQLALNAARSARLEREVASWSHKVAISHQDRGDLAEARQLYYESLEINTKLGNQGDRGPTLHQLAILAHDQGELEKAQQLYNESLGIAIQRDDQKSVSSSLHQLATLAKDRGEFDEARRLYGQSLEIAKNVGAEHSVSISLRALGSLAQDCGELVEAKQLYDETLAISERLGDQSGVACTLYYLGVFHLTKKDYESAEKLLQESLDILRKLGDKKNCAECVESFGKIRVAQGRFAEARSLFDEALGIAEKIEIPFRIASVKHSLALLSEKQGDKSSATKLVQEALTIFVELHSPKAEDARRDLKRMEDKSS